MSVTGILRVAEERLRARGLTGAAAFGVLLDGLRHRLGDPIPIDDELQSLVSELPIDGSHDLLGLSYEHFFPDQFKAARGQYFTPPPLVDLVLSRLDVNGRDLLDPTCGAGGFLLRAARLGARVRGVEIDPALTDLARINLRLARQAGDVENADWFRADPRPAEVVVANPPFSMELRDPELLAAYEIARGRDRIQSDWLFVEALERWVVPGGSAGVILPWSVLQNPRSRPVRERLASHWEMEALCGLPEGVFRPFGGAGGRAVIFWMRRVRNPRRCAALWTRITDPGYDVRSGTYRATTSTEIAERAAGEHWEVLPRGAWVPVQRTTSGIPLSQVATDQTLRIRPSLDPEGAFAVIDLADTDRRTGEVVAVSERSGAEVKGQKACLEADDILVSRLRPSLGNVVMARRPRKVTGALVGSPEWICLRSELPHYLLHALRTPVWRSQLSITGGQTRPRTTQDAVMSTQVPWPGEETAVRIDRVARQLREQRARLADILEALQERVDAFAEDAAALDALTAFLDSLEDQSESPGVDEEQGPSPQ